MTATHLAPRRVRHAPILASLAVLLGAAACGGAAPSAPPAAQSEPPAAQSEPPASSGGSPTVPPIPTKDGALEPRTYRMAASPWSVADFTVTVPQGWNIQYGQILSTSTEGGEEMAFSPILPDKVWTAACAGSDSGAQDVGPSVDDLAAALDAQEDSVASEPVPTTIGGHEGVRVDLTIPDGFDLHPCNVQDVGFQIAYNTATDGNLVLIADGTMSAHILDIDGKRSCSPRRSLRPRLTPTAPSSRRPWTRSATSRSRATSRSTAWDARPGSG